MRRVKQAVVVIVVILAAAQLIRPTPMNVPVDPRLELRAHSAATPELAAVVDRACGDCHSNRSVWPPAARVAPLSWVMSKSVEEGRKVVNFSEWAGYPPDVQRTLLSASCDDARSGKMPGPYTWVRPETRLAPHDIDVICEAARQASTQGGRR